MSSALDVVDRRTSGGEVNLGLKFTSPQFSYKNSGFWDQIFTGELKPQRCTQVLEGYIFCIIIYLFALKESSQIRDSLKIDCVCARHIE